MFELHVELRSDWFCVVFSDEEQEQEEKAGPSQTEPCSGDTSANCQSDGTATAEPLPDLNHSQPSLDHGDTETNNGSQNQTEPPCSADATTSDSTDNTDPSSSGAADTGPEPPAERMQQPCETTEEEEKEEDKQEEACSPIPPANEQPAKRRATRKRRKSLFTIQAVNSNGTTERGTGEGGSAVSFSCKSAHTPSSSLSHHDTDSQHEDILTSCSHFFNINFIVPNRPHTDIKPIITSLYIMSLYLYTFSFKRTNYSTASLSLCSSAVCGHRLGP